MRKVQTDLQTEKRPIDSTPPSLPLGSSKIILVNDHPISFLAVTFPNLQCSSNGQPSPAHSQQLFTDKNVSYLTQTLPSLHQTLASSSAMLISLLLT